MTIELDRRQRVAAVLCLAAVDLPQEALAFSQHLIDAAKLCPGITMAELPDLNSCSREACLKRARKLIDEMLAELAPTQPAALGGQHAILDGPNGPELGEFIERQRLAHPNLDRLGLGDPEGRN